MEKKAEDYAEIAIFDEIDSWWGIGPKEFKAALDPIKGVKSIKLLLNSPGGSVFDGWAIYNLLAEIRAKLTVEVVGLAASIASIIALAGSKLVMAEGSYYMIHNPWTRMSGASEDLRKAADLLDKFRADFVAIYARESGLDNTEVGKLMAAETWLSASEAVEKGFASEVSGYGDVAAKIGPIGRYGFANIPQALALPSNERIEIATERDLESLLRDAGGLSRSRAAAIVAHGWKGNAETQGEPGESARGDPAEETLKDLMARIREKEIDLEYRRMK
jgi:ATP-dependent Clp endopeptidase proteolytic subunit ClpP